MDNHQANQAAVNTNITRFLLVTLTAATTATAVWWFLGVIVSGGWSLLDLPLVALFATLFVWVAFSFWTATLGLLAILSKPGEHQPPQPLTPVEKQSLPRTAVLMPIYNEDVKDVFAGVRAMLNSMQKYECEELFDVFVLSDTTNADIWLEEERAWARLVAEFPSSTRVFYRHRPMNHSRKAGNIADFCTRWGEHYPYMVVLDADSVMEAETLVEMVRRMERDAKIGILQAPPTPVNRTSFFARMQQFAARVYGPVFLEGFALWSHCDGNYWGHNAIIRIAPFMEHCDLPILPGKGPLGGEILSHDFVEAALMRRAGWKVCLAHDLEGSYEECPPTMLDFAQRDQRWCQGNLQHTKLLLAEGIHPASRLHLGMGVMSYVASPLWLVFLVLSIVRAFVGGGWVAETSSAVAGGFLFAATMAMLLLPKVWGVIALRHQKEKLKAQGGLAAVIGGMLIETLTSILIAPIMMLLHTQFVFSTLSGRKVRWDAQSRSENGVSLRDAFKVHYAHTLIGVAVAVLLWAAAPGLLPWMSPVLLGLILSIPLSKVVGSVQLGKDLADADLLLIPEETNQPEILAYKAAAAKNHVNHSGDLFAAVLSDPTFYALHVGIQHATQSHQPLSPDVLDEVIATLDAQGPSAVEIPTRRAVLCDSAAMETLHVHRRCQQLSGKSALLA